MKKLVFPMYMCIFAFLIVLSSCGKKKDETPKPGPKPTIGFQNGNGLVKGAVTIEPGMSIKVGIDASSGGSNLKTISVDRNGSAVNLFDNSNTKTLSGTSYKEVITIPSPTAAESYTYNFTVTAEDGQTSTLTLPIKVNLSSTEQINFYPNYTLGVQSNTIESFYSTSEGMVYNYAAATEKSNLIDFAYYNTPQGISQFASPSDVYAESLYGFNGWTRNTTSFKPSSLSAAAFDDLTNGLALRFDYTETQKAIPFESKTAKLEVGSVYVFETAAKKYGMLKVNSITPGVNGTINFTVKMQK